MLATNTLDTMSLERGFHATHQNSTLRAFTAVTQGKKHANVTITEPVKQHTTYVLSLGLDGCSDWMMLT